MANNQLSGSLRTFRIDEKYIFAYITNIEWSLESINGEWEAIDVVLNYTVVTFNVDVEIWNMADINQTVKFSSGCEFPLCVNASFMDENLNLLPFYICTTAITPRIYQPGITNKSFSYPFGINRLGLSTLPDGTYEIGLGAPIPTFGLTLTVSESKYSIEYDEQPFTIPSVPATSIPTSSINSSIITSFPPDTIIVVTINITFFNQYPAEKELPQTTLPLNNSVISEEIVKNDTPGWTFFVILASIIVIIPIKRFIKRFKQFS